MTGAIDRFRENATTVTALLFLGVGIVAFGLNVPWFWVILLVGILVVAPLVGMLTGDDDWRKWDPFSDEFWEDAFGEEDVETESKSESGPKRSIEDEPDPLQTVREQYARGDLTDAEFERKLELLLETETVADVQRRLEARDRDRDDVLERDGERDRNERDRDRDGERDRNEGDRDRDGERDRNEGDRDRDEGDRDRDDERIPDVE